jgi:hypothetical protein
MAPWKEHNSASWDVLQADSVLQFYGWRDQVFHAWGSNHLPLWSNNELGGTPLLANSQSGGFYPPHILIGVLQLPTSMGMAWLAWFHLFWAGLGVYLLCRRLGGAKTIALIAAAGFALSSFMLAWTSLPSVIETISWIPWILFGLYRIPERKGVLILAASVALCLLAGHLQFAAYGLMAAAIAFVARLIQERSTWRVMVISGLVGLVGGTLLAAPQLLPVLDFGQHSHRRNVPTAEGYQAYTAGALPIWQMLSIPDSQLLGVPTTEMKLAGASINGFWPALLQRGGNFAESAIGLGPIILWLLVIGLRRKTAKQSAGISAVGLFGLLLAVGTPLCALLYYGLPGWSATGSTGRAGVLFVLAACVLAGSWNPADEPLTTKALRDRSLVFAGISVACVGIIFRLPLTSWIQGLAIDDLDAAVPHGLLAAKTLGVALTAIAAGTILVRMPKAAPYAAGVLAALVALMPGASLIRSSQSRLPDIGGATGRIAVVNGNAQWDLLQTPTALLPPNTAALCGLHELGGYDSIIDQRTRDALAGIDGTDPAPAANGNMMFVKPSFDPTKLADAGVTDVWALTPLPQLGPPPNPIDGIYKYRLPGKGRAYTSSGPATLSHETTQSLELEATGPGVLTLKDHLQEGWSAYVDETHVEFEHDPWPQVQLPAGRHTVRFKYWPHGITVGFDAMVLGLLIIALYVAGSQRFPLRKAQPVVQ